MTKMKGVFPQSRELRDIIESHKWTLYDVFNPPEGRAYTFRELDQRTPAEQYEVGHNYLFVPIPEKGQTLREAYTPTKGLGPSLTIENPDDDRWLSLYVQKKANEMVALFTRLFMHEECVFVTTPEPSPDPDFVAIRYDNLIDTFKRYFRIVSPEEYGLTAPIPDTLYLLSVVGSTNFC